MKRVFISMPMQGLNEEEIKKEQNRLLYIAKDILKDEVEHVPNYLGKDTYNPLDCLGKSLSIMSEADYVIFGKGWEDARGCRIEHMCAKAYGVAFFAESSGIVSQMISIIYRGDQAPLYIIDIFQGGV